ncbi:BppU family phage baseplate upper protein [Bacillus wiedmannii]|uniref:BppU family phage baseplate upper protein n=1 Tax=Bacillus wiedmannii TaxID=1890302 RepID=UPI001596BE20|nr:BppU family phage baseplate upper protein [Bacillus wiedmannii]
MPRTITARENDRNGFKVIGNLRERGKSVDLTGFAVFYEAISPLGMFVRDIAVITNFRDGVFEYIVSKEAVSSSGVWIGYFAFEKGTERFTTQDIRISLGVDVKSGSIQLENYITEFDTIKKQVDALQIAVDNANVVKRSGGTMTGDLNLDRPSATTYRELRWSTAGVNDILLGQDTSGNWRVFDSASGAGSIFKYEKATKRFTVDVANTNLVKKTGDTMTGYLRMDTESGEKGIIYKDNTAEFLKVYTGKNRNHGLLDIIANKPVYEYDFNTKTFSILADFKTKNDTDWINLTLLNGVKQQSSQPASAIKRSGNVVNIVCAITDFKDKQVIANVPAIFRPDREMLFTCDYFQGLVLKTGYVIVKPNGDIYLEGIEAAVSLYRFVLTYIV